MGQDEQTAEHRVKPTESGVLAATVSADDLSWAVVKMRAGARIVVNEGSSPPASSAILSVRRNPTLRRSPYGAGGRAGYRYQRRRKLWRTILTVARRRGASRPRWTAKKRRSPRSISCAI